MLRFFLKTLLTLERVLEMKCEGFKKKQLYKTDEEKQNSAQKQKTAKEYT